MKCVAEILLTSASIAGFNMTMGNDSAPIVALLVYRNTATYKAVIKNKGETAPRRGLEVNASTDEPHQKNNRRVTKWQQRHNLPN